ENRFRMTKVVDVDGKAYQQVIVSDGKSTAYQNDSATPKTFSEAASKSEFEHRIALLARVDFESFATPSWVQQNTEEFKRGELPPVKEFKLGPRETIGKKETQVVEYVTKIKLLGEREMQLRVSVWIDTKANVPTKRVCQIQEK